MNCRLLISVFLLACPWSQAGAEDADEKRRQLENIRLQIERSVDTINRAESKKKDVQTGLMQTEKEISYIGHRLYLIQKSYDLQKIRWVELQSTKIMRQQALDVERRRLGELLRSAYSMSRYGDIRLFLNQENPMLFSRMMTYHDYFNRQRVILIERVEQQLKALEETQHAFRLQSNILKRLKYRQEQELAKLDQIKKQKQLLLDSIRKDIDNEGQQLDRLRKDELAMKKILKMLTDLLEDIPKSVVGVQSFAQLKGKLPWPNVGKVIRQFDKLRGSTGQSWSGVVIGAERGSNVIAVARGQVVFSDWLRGYGLLLIMDHGDGYMSLYGHNESVYKDTGEWVEAGDVIASVGDSGGQTHPGLYFEIRHNGRPVNLVKWCVKYKPGVRGKAGVQMING